VSDVNLGSCLCRAAAQACNQAALGVCPAPAALHSRKTPSSACGGRADKFGCRTGNIRESTGVRGVLAGGFGSSSSSSCSSCCAAAGVSNLGVVA
jgi:hypothetical protein